MEVSFKVATEHDANIIGDFVIKLTQEICERTNNFNHFDIGLETTVERCRSLIRDGHYFAIIAMCNDIPLGVSTFTETYALYAGGKVGVIHEFYVDTEVRSSGVGSKLIEAVKNYGSENGWSCVELCTPPLPEFERTLSFYQSNGLNPVGGRKMRQYIVERG